MAEVDVPSVQLEHVIGRKVSPASVDTSMDPVHYEEQSRSAKETKYKAEQIGRGTYIYSQRCLWGSGFQRLTLS